MVSPVPIPGPVGYGQHVYRVTLDVKYVGDENDNHVGVQGAGGIWEGTRSTNYLTKYDGDCT